MNHIFILNSRLEADTFFVQSLENCQLRLMNDSRWLWLILVPEIANMEEWHHLPADVFERINQHIRNVAATLERVTPCDKINVASLGNMVRQLHIHVVARRQGDANWPRPIWGYGRPVFYEKAEAARLIKIFGEAII